MPWRSLSRHSYGSNKYVCAYKNTVTAWFIESTVINHAFLWIPPLWLTSICLDGGSVNKRKTWCQMKYSIPSIYVDRRMESFHHCLYSVSNCFVIRHITYSVIYILDGCIIETQFLGIKIQIHTISMTKWLQAEFCNMILYVQSNMHTLGCILWTGTPRFIIAIITPPAFG